MKLRFTAKQWRDYLFIRAFCRFRYHFELTPVCYTELFTAIYEGDA